MIDDRVTGTALHCTAGGWVTDKYMHNVMYVVERQVSSSFVSH